MLRQEHKTDRHVIYIYEYTNSLSFLPLPQFLGCDRSDNLCNCDTNDDIWRKDDGILNDKDTLPVSQLRIGDTGGTDEAALYHLGPLKCKGIGKSTPFW